MDGKPISSAKAVDDVLSHWLNIKAVFNEVLAFNGIDIAMKEYAAEMWEEAGEKMATAFIAQAELFLEPGLRKLFNLDEKEAN